MLDQRHAVRDCFTSEVCGSWPALPKHQHFQKPHDWTNHPCQFGSPIFGHGCVDIVRNMIFGCALQKQVQHHHSCRSEMVSAYIGAEQNRMHKSIIYHAACKTCGAFHPARSTTITGVGYSPDDSKQYNDASSDDRRARKLKLSLPFSLRGKASCSSRSISSSIRVAC